MLFPQIYLYRLRTVNLASFFLQTAARSSYVGETNVVAKAINSLSIGPGRLLSF
jgi:hypothetical protein